VSDEAIRRHLNPTQIEQAYMEGKAEGVELERVRQSTKRCISCKHWSGDVEKARGLIEEHGLRVISPDHGFVDAAPCGRVLHEAIVVDVICTGYGSGYDSVNVEFEPWFGCFAWEKRV
jgi:hypothetical protein